MDISEIKFKNRRISGGEEGILDDAIKILSKKKSYYYTKKYILKLRKNDRD